MHVTEANQQLHDVTCVSQDSKNYLHHGILYQLSSRIVPSREHCCNVEQWSPPLTWMELWVLTHEAPLVRVAAICAFPWSSTHASGECLSRGHLCSCMKLHLHEWSFMLMCTHLPSACLSGVSCASTCLSLPQPSFKQAITQGLGTPDVEHIVIM